MKLFDLKSLYTILKKSDSLVSVKYCNEEHPIFKAHFPKNPLLPGFCHIDILAQILEDNIKKVNLLKLKQKTYPNDIVSYEITTLKNKRKIKIIDQQNKPIGSITYEYI